jgi:hypothetical protein
MIANVTVAITHQPEVHRLHGVERRAMKHKQHRGQGNPRDEWVMSSRPEHPALVPIDLFFTAQPGAAASGAGPGRPRPDDAETHTRRPSTLQATVLCVLRNCARSGLLWLVTDVYIGDWVTIGGIPRPKLTSYLCSIIWQWPDEGQRGGGWRRR